jgi:hypothetical protein
MTIHLPRWLRRRRSLAGALAPYSVTRPLTEGVSRPRGNLAIAHDNRRSYADRHLDPRAQP